MKYCNDYAALLDLFADGELTAEEMVRVQTHLDECPACRAYVDDALAIRAAFPDVEDTEVPAGFAGGVMAAIQASARNTAPKRKNVPWIKVALPLAACCAIVILLRQNGPLSVRNESAADTAAPAAAHDMGTDTAAAESAAQAAPAEAPAETEEAETDVGSARARDESWSALVESFQPGAAAEIVYDESQTDAGGGPYAYSSESVESGETDAAVNDVMEEYAEDAEAEESVTNTAAPVDTSSPAGGGTQSSPGVSETLPWDGASEKNGEETDPDAYDGPKLRLTAEEAGDLLAGYAPVSETETEVRYLLTEEEYQTLLDALPEDIRMNAAVWNLGGAMIIVEK